MLTIVESHRFQDSLGWNGERIYCGNRFTDPTLLKSLWENASPPKNVSGLEFMLLPATTPYVGIFGSLLSVFPSGYSGFPFFLNNTVYIVIRSGKGTQSDESQPHQFLKLLDVTCLNKVSLASPWILTLGHTRKVIPPPWYKGGLMESRLVFLTCRSISKRFCLQWKACDLLHKMRDL